jgi:hypothetical protein
MKTFYFVRAPLAGGGRHLANLISLDAGINQYQGRKLSKQKWVDFLFDCYRSNDETAHYAGTVIISDATWAAEALAMMEVSDSVHHGHSASFDWAQAVLEKIKNKRFVSLTFNSPESRSILLKREKEVFGTATLENQYYVEELAHFYNREFTDDVLCNADVNLAVEVKDIFENDVGVLIDKINQHYGIAIPIVTAQQLHNIWLKNKVIFKG